MVRCLNDREIMDPLIEPGTLFRQTTLASTLMEQYMRSTCSSFVSLALKDVVKEIIDSKQCCEVSSCQNLRKAVGRGHIVTIAFKL